MIPLSRHTGQLLNTDRTPIIDPIDISLETDEMWSPRWRGRVTIHADDLAALTDRVIVRLRSAFGSDLSIAALTEWAGASVSGMTARAGGVVSAITAYLTRPWNPFETISPVSYFTTLYGGDVSTVTAAHGGTVASLTAQSRQPGGAYLPPSPQHVEATLTVRDIRSNTREGTHEIELAGADIALHDYRHMSATTYVSPHTSLRALTQYVLDLVGGTLAPGTDVTIAAGAEWSPGQTAWDFLHPVAEANGWTIWADESATYNLAAATVNASPIELDAETNLTEWTPETAPTDDAVLVEYTGETPVAYDIYAPAGFKRPRIETRETTYPGAGAAQEIALRAATRAKTGVASCTNLYGIRPLDRVTVRPPSAPLTATVSSVEWNYPAATMSVRVRDLVTL